MLNNVGWFSLFSLCATAVYADQTTEPKEHRQPPAVETDPFALASHYTYTPTFDGLSRFTFEIPRNLNISGTSVVDDDELLYLSNFIDNGVHQSRLRNNFWNLSLSEGVSELVRNYHINTNTWLDFGVKEEAKEFSPVFQVHTDKATGNNSLQTYGLSIIGSDVQLRKSSVSLAYRETYEVLWSVAIGTESNTTKADLGIRWFLQPVPIDILAVLEATHGKSTAAILLERQIGNFGNFIGVTLDLTSSKSQFLYGVNIEIAGSGHQRLNIATKFLDIQRATSLKMLTRQAIHRIWRNADFSDLR